jgi:hypothetical protein
VSALLDSLLTQEQAIAVAQHDTGRPAKDYTKTFYESAAAQALKDSEELAAYRGTHAKPQPGCKFARLTLCDAPVLVEYEYEAGEAAQLYGPPENCYEGSPETLTILGVLINGVWCDHTEFASDMQIDRWEQAILAEIEDARQTAEEDRAEARRHGREHE